MNAALDQYVVFGNPISHSKSPSIHTMFAQQTQQNLNYQTSLVGLHQFPQAVSEFVRRGGRGANVTVPFKLEAFSLSTRLTERARSAGAVNTLHFVNAEIIGDNTDGAGLVRDIQVNAGVAIAGKRVLLLGAGGAARGALLPLLAEKPAALVIANRTVSKAQDLVNLAKEFVNTEFDLSAKTWTEIEGQFDIVINATSASLSDDVPPIPNTVFHTDCLAYDMMYGDADTSFLTFAKSHGAAVRDGLGMLVEQAAEAFFIWRGIRPDTLPVLHALRKGSQS